MPSRLLGVALPGALSVLEECTDALAVYQRTLKNRRTPAVRSLADIDCLQRRVPAALSEASIKHPDVKNSRAAFDMGKEEVIFEKLQQDTLWLEELIRAAQRQLNREGHLDVLVDEVVRKLARRSDEEELLAQARDTQLRLDQMRQQVIEQRKTRDEEETQLKAELLRLRNEKEKLGVKSRAESTFAEAWLDFRSEQHSLRADMSRNQLANELQRCRIREDNERLVTDRVEQFLRQSIEENEQAAREWTERRRAETRRYEAEVHALQEEIKCRRAALEVLQSEYKERQDFIDACLAEKEAARRKRELEAHVRGCAVAIQAWWRGVMVRRKLGPYRPEEKKRKRPAKPKK